MHVNLVQYIRAQFSHSLLAKMRVGFPDFSIFASTVIKSITRKFLRVDLILIKLIYNVKVLKSVKLKLTQVFLHIFSQQIV